MSSAGKGAGKRPGRIVRETTKAAGREIVSAGGEIGVETIRRVGRYVGPKIRSIGVPLPSLQTSPSCNPDVCVPFCSPPGICDPCNPCPPS